MNMVESWMDPPEGSDDMEWEVPQSALEPLPRAGVNWPSIGAGVIVALMLVWTAVVGWTLATDPTAPLSARALLPRLALACVPLVLGAVVLLLIRLSETVSRQRIARGEAHALGGAERLMAAERAFAEQLTSGRRAATDQADRWHGLADALTERTDRLSEQLSHDLAALDGRLERVDAAAGAARRDLTVVLAGVPKVDRQVRELVGNLREAGLTAHEGAGALDAQIGLLRHRVGEADEIAGAATARLAGQLERMEAVAGAAAAQLGEAGEAAARQQDALFDRAEAALARASEALAERGRDLGGVVEGAERRLGDAGERAGAELAARLDLLDERARAVVATAGSGERQVDGALTALEKRLGELDRQIAATGERGAVEAHTLAASLDGLRAQGEALTGQLTAGGEAMDFATGRAESLLSALDAASRELDETLPASFGRFERSAGEGFQRLSDAMPELDRYHERTQAATAALAQSEDRVLALGEAFDARTREADNTMAALAERMAALDASLQSAADERAPHLLGTIQAASDVAAGLGTLAAQTIDAALPDARQRLIEAVTGPVGDAIGSEVQASAERAAGMADEALARVGAAIKQLQTKLDELARTGRALTERGDSVLAMASEENEESFSRRSSLLIEALNSTAVDVAKVLSNDVSDVAWAAYLKGDRGVFTRRAVRLLDSGQAREIVRAYGDDGEFRAQVNRYVHDFEALLRTVLADANGSVLAVALLSSDTGKLYVALAQAIERLRG